MDQLESSVEIKLAINNLPKDYVVGSFLVLRKDDGHVLRKALEFEVKDKRKRGRPKRAWKTQVGDESKRFSLEKEDAMNRARWRVGVGEIAVRVG